MIWHIFKKDWKVLWPLVMIVAAAQFMNAALSLILGHFGEPHELAKTAEAFLYVVLLAIAVLIVTAVHQDAVPGDRQDWLVRPIRPRDLILEKLLFVLVTVHGPMLLANLMHGLVTGFAFWDSLSVALSHGVYMLLAFSLPVLALAAITATLVEVIGGALAIVLIVISINLVIRMFDPGGTEPNTATAWVILSLESAVLLAAAVAVIALQYFQRATMRARGIALGAVLLVPLIILVPWAPTFAFQQWLSPDPAAARAVVIAFDPNLGKYTLEPGGRSRANSVWLPLRVSGLPTDSRVIGDRADIRIIGRDGKVLFRGRTTGDPQITGDPGVGPDHIDDLPVRTTAGGDVLTHQLIILPGKLYELIRSQPVRMELNYSLTLFRIEASDIITALNGDKRITNFGWCKTRIDDNGDAVEIGCIKTGYPPTCATLVLVNTVSGRRNPAYEPCTPDYQPYIGFNNDDAMVTFGGPLTLRDPQGLAKYPVDNSQLANAQVSLKSYKPVAHFTRQLIIPEIRLGDWEAGASDAATGTRPPQ